MPPTVGGAGYLTDAPRRAGLVMGSKSPMELDLLLQGRPDFYVHFSRTQVAASLWDYAEDDHAHCALERVSRGIG